MWLAARVASVLALWLLIAVAFYVGCIALLSLSPLPRVVGAESSFGYFVGALQSFSVFLPRLAGASVVPAALHLLGQRLAWLWSWVFLASSILLPAIWVLRLRASYREALALYGHVEGEGLWNAFLTVGPASFYGAMVALTFAVMAARNARASIMSVQVWAAAIVTLLHASVAATAFLAPVGLLHLLEGR